jgi:hypothetical protein
MDLSLMNYNFSQRFERIKRAIFEIPYVYYFLGAFIFYIIIDILANKSYVTFSTFFRAFRPSFYIPFLIFNLLIAFLVGLNISLVIMKFKDLKKIQGEEGATFFGVFLGLLGGACPGCFAGLFPAFLGLFGISLTLGNLPFLGLEILFGSLILLLISAVLLTRNSVCKVNLKHKNVRRK